MKKLGGQRSGCTIEKLMPRVLECYSVRGLLMINNIMINIVKLRENEFTYIILSSYF